MLEETNNFGQNLDDAQIIFLDETTSKNDDDSFVSLSYFKSSQPNEGTEQDINHIILKKNIQMKEVGQIKKKNKTIVQISGGFR